MIPRHCPLPTRLTRHSSRPAKTFGSFLNILSRGRLNAVVRPISKLSFTMDYNEKISKAHNVKKVLSIFQIISEALSRIDKLNYVKIYNGRIKASNRISENGKKELIVEIGGENIIGVELLIDIEIKTIQFYFIGNLEKPVPFMLRHAQH